MDTDAEDMAPLEPGEDWQTLQGADPDMQQVRVHVEQGRAPNKTERAVLSESAKKLLKQWKILCIHKGILCRCVFDSYVCEPRFQIVCPDSKRQEVWRRYHEATAHAGVEKTLAHLSRHFFWPSMEKGVQCFQNGCVVCSLQKYCAEPRAPLKPITVSYTLEVVALDFLSLRQPSDTYQNILVMTDMFTRYSWTVPTRDQTAQTTVRAIRSSNRSVAQRVSIQTRDQILNQNL